MSLEARQRVVARLLTDPAYQETFFSAQPGDAASHGLTQEEFGMLRGLNRRRLSISAEGYLGKRFERVESAYPRTLALLDRLQPEARGHYLATTAFPKSEADEQATFREHVSRGFGRPPHAQRLLMDLLEAETALLALPPPQPFRNPAPGARPRATGLGLVRARGPLDAALASGFADLTAYPEAPRTLALGRQGSALRLEPLDAGAEADLARLDGTASWEKLAFDAQATARLTRWLRDGLVDEL